MAEPFIPRDKPKSLVVFICAGLSALLVFAPIIGMGIYFGTNWLRQVGVLGFVACWGVMAVSGVVSTLRNWSGYYKNLVPRDWKDQVW